MTSTPSDQGGPPDLKSSKPRGSPWHVALEPLIVTHVIGPLIKSVLEAGVESQTDLLERLCSHPSILAVSQGQPAVISMEKLRQWLKETGYGSIFERKTIYSLKPTGPETALLNSIRAADSTGTPSPSTLRPDDDAPGMPREFVEPSLGDDADPLPEDERPRHSVPISR